MTESESAGQNQMIFFYFYTKDFLRSRENWKFRKISCFSKIVKMTLISAIRLQRFFTVHHTKFHKYIHFGNIPILSCILNCLKPLFLFFENFVYIYIFLLFFYKKKIKNKKKIVKIPKIKWRFYFLCFSWKSNNFF
jgi:hypothetical protein